MIKSIRGGKRQGAGRPPSPNPKVKITVSVDAELLARRMKGWTGSRSALFEKLLAESEEAAPKDGSP